MSSTDESAIDAMVGEVMSGRAAAEAAAAPAPIVPPVVPDQRDAEPEVTIGFADPGQAAPEVFASESFDVDDIQQLRSERDSYLADTQRLTADFANFRKQSEKRIAETAASQSASLVRSLLPVLDACDSALDLDPESAVAPIRTALIGELERNGLELLAPIADETFDPEKHEAVIHEAADAEHPGPIVREVLRAGYLWKGRVVRPAMVKVVG